MAGGSAGVKSKITDLSQIIPTVSQVIGATVGECKFGPVGVPQLITSTNLEEKLGKPMPGSNLHRTINAFLQKAGSLWVIRVANGAKFGVTKILQTNPGARKIGSATAAGPGVDYSGSLGEGQIIPKSLVFRSPGTNEVQDIDFDAVPDAGSFQIQYGSLTSTAILFSDGRYAG